MKISIPLLLILLLCSCGPRPIDPGPLGPEGCEQPPADVFTQAGVDFEFAESTFGQVVLGKIDLETNPEVITLASKAVTNDRIKAYLRCLDIHKNKFTQAQAAHSEAFRGLMETGPTADQVITWQKNNPFPGGDISADDHMMVTLPDTLTFHDAVKKLVRDTGATEKLTDCDAVKKAQVEGGRISAKDEIRIIENLAQRFVDDSIKIELVINKDEDAGRINITCNSTP